MNEIIKELTYDKLEKFITDISYNGKLYNIFKTSYIFRGLPSDKYELIPNALRASNQESLFKLSGIGGAMPNIEFMQISAEFNLLYKFFKKCDYYGLHIPDIPQLRSDIATNGIKYLIESLAGEQWIPNNLLELAGLAQHYGIPTRLLDWSQDIFVALYFAASGALKIREKKEEKSKYIVLWALDSLHLDTFNDDEIPLKLVRLQYNGNPNLCAQKGLFTLWQMPTSLIYKSGYPPKANRNIEINRNPLDQLILNNPIIKEENATILYKILISTSETEKLYEYLRHIEYNASRLFPGYDGITKSIKEDSLFFNSEAFFVDMKSE